MDEREAAFRRWEARDAAARQWFDNKVSPLYRWRANAKKHKQWKDIKYIDKQIANAEAWMHKKLKTLASQLAKDIGAIELAEIAGGFDNGRQKYKMKYRHIK